MCVQTNMSNFQSLEVVDRCSETQLQLVDNLNKLTQDKDKDYIIIWCPLMRYDQSCFDCLFDALQLLCLSRHGLYHISYHFATAFGVFCAIVVAVFTSYLPGE